MSHDLIFEVQNTQSKLYYDSNLAELTLLFFFSWVNKEPFCNSDYSS